MDQAGISIAVAWRFSRELLPQQLAWNDFPLLAAMEQHRGSASLSRHALRYCSIAIADYLCHGKSSSTAAPQQVACLGMVLVAQRTQKQYATAPPSFTHARFVLNETAPGKPVIWGGKLQHRQLQQKLVDTLDEGGRVFQLATLGQQGLVVQHLSQIGGTSGVGLFGQTFHQYMLRVDLQRRLAGFHF
jgi:hypothetical protein